MSARKRKSPDRRKPVRQPGLLSSIVSTAGRAVARHPRPVVGVAAFGVVFSFIAANALWYQPGGHPAPFLATRDARDPNAIAGYRPMRRAAPEDVTTFRIERADPDAPARVAEPASAPSAAPLPEPMPAAVPAPRPETAAETQSPKPAPVETAKAPAAAPAKPAQPTPSPKVVPVSRPPASAARRDEDPVAAAIRAADRAPAMRPPADIPNTGSTPRRQATPVAQKPANSTPSTDLVLQIQRGLSNIAYADVAVDGVAGEQTKAAIRRFQKHYRLPETGEPDVMVLKKLKSIGAL